MEHMDLFKSDEDVKVFKSSDIVNGVIDLSSYNIRKLYEGGG